MINRKKTLKIILALLLVGFIAWAIIPIFLNNEVQEAAPESATIITKPADNVPQENDLSSAVEEEQDERVGAFSGKNGYSAEGGVKLIEDVEGVRYVRFEDNFSASNGPDLIVYLGTVDDRGTSLGKLKGNIGSQNYEVPDSVNLSTVDTVRVFCRSFNADFAIATL